MALFYKDSHRLINHLVFFQSEIYSQQKLFLRLDSVKNNFIRRVYRLKLNPSDTSVLFTLLFYLTMQKLVSKSLTVYLHSIPKRGVKQPKRDNVPVICAKCNSINNSTT